MKTWFGQANTTFPHAHVASRRFRSCDKNRDSNAERFNSPDDAATLSRSDSAAAVPDDDDDDDIEAILLVAHNVMEKRPKRIGRGPDSDDDEPILG